MADKPKVQIVPQRVLCQLFDLTPRRINQLVKDNVIPTPVARDQYDLIGCIRAYIAFLRKGEDGSAITAHRTRKERWKADMAELELKRATGELVSMASVLEALETIFSACKMRLLAIPAKIAARIRMCANALEAQELMRTEIEHALEELNEARIIVNRIVADHAADGRDDDADGDEDLETAAQNDSLAMGGSGADAVA